MKEQHKTLYLANISEEHISCTGRELLEREGWQIDGNWINGAQFSDNYKVILLASAQFGDAFIFTYKELKGSRVFNYLLFPDELVGWDCEGKRYIKRPTLFFKDVLYSFPVLSSSEFTLKLVVDTYKDSVNKERQVSYLPIEFQKIRHEAARLTKDSKRVTVLWNHMWRSDKGFPEAMSIIERLSRQYPEVEFHIGRDEKWGLRPDVPKIKSQTRPILNILSRRENIFLHRQFKDPRDYWQFISSFDIGFSVSFHEGFGLSMLEQAAAGLACVLPNRESYPEIHKGALITENVAEGIATLIEDSLKRLEISQSCIENARRFNAEEWTTRLSQIISDDVKISLLT